ncbi:MAG: hypothetical protein IJD60_06385 [Clostridia bacterium]|nr:hypothetical protein [Clostridia bacterium]
MALQKGFVILHRSLLSWGWHDDPSTGWLFVNLILMANCAPVEWKGIKIERGQLVTGRKSLAEQTGLSEQSVRTALNHLKSTGEITIKPTNKYSLITIVNYRKFQDIPETSTSKLTSKLTSNQPAANQQLTTTEQEEQEEQEVVYASAAEDDLFDQIAAHQRADDLIRRYRLPDSDPTREAVLEDAEKVGFDRLEEVLKQASLSNNRQGLSVNFYRTVLNGSGKQKEANIYAGYRQL